MRNVDASRADFRGASLAGVDVHGATLRRAKCQNARMAGMWSGVQVKARPEVKANEDGAMPPVEPLDATEAVGWDGVAWAEEEATPVDTAKDGEEDAQDEAALAAHKQEQRENHGFEEGELATLVDMQHVDAL